MTRVIQLTGIALLLISGFLEYESLRLRYYTSLGPGPGFFGVWLAGLAAICAIGVIITASRGPNIPLPETFWPTKIGLIRMAVVLLGVAWMAAFLEDLGYVVTSFVFLAALIYVMGTRSLSLIFSMAILGSVGIYLLFTRVLYTPLPRGILNF